MNKFKFFLIAAIALVASTSSMAQKTGYISVDQAVSIMPEVARIDTTLQRFQRDSLNQEFASLVQEYNYKDSLLTKTDTTKMPIALRRQYRQDIEGIAYQVQNWQSISQNVMQNKQQTLLEPVYRRLMTTIQQIAKENGYTYVYNKEALLVAPPGDDLLPLVARKLNIKLPTGEAGNLAPSAQRQGPSEIKTKVKTKQ